MWIVINDCPSIAIYFQHRAPSTTWQSSFFCCCLSIIHAAMLHNTPPLSSFLSKLHHPLCVVPVGTLPKARHGFSFLYSASTVLMPVFFKSFSLSHHIMLMYVMALLLLHYFNNEIHVNSITYHYYHTYHRESKKSGKRHSVNWSYPIHTSCTVSYQPLGQEHNTIKTSTKILKI